MDVGKKLATVWTTARLRQLLDDLADGKADQDGWWRKFQMILRGKDVPVAVVYLAVPGAWQTYVWSYAKERWNPVRSRGRAAEILVGLAFELLETLGALIVPRERQPGFETAYALPFVEVTAEVALLQGRAEDGVLGKGDRERLLRGLDRLQGFEAIEERWQGKGPLHSAIAQVHIAALRALGRENDRVRAIRAQRRAAAATVLLPPEGARAPLCVVTKDRIVRLPEDICQDLGLVGEAMGVTFVRGKDGHVRMLSDAQFLDLFEVRGPGTAPDPPGALEATTNLAGLGELLVKLREQSGMTQRAFAKRLGVHEAQVSRDERQRYRGASLARLKKTLDALGVQLRSEVRS